MGGWCSCTRILCPAYFFSARLERITLSIMMLNCYKPLAAPREDDGTNKDGKVSNGEPASQPDPAAPPGRGDGRSPNDMRQVRLSLGRSVCAAKACWVHKRTLNEHCTRCNLPPSSSVQYVDVAEPPAGRLERSIRQSSSSSHVFHSAICTRASPRFGVLKMSVR